MSEPDEEEEEEEEGIPEDYDASSRSGVGDECMWVKWKARRKRLVVIFST